MGTFAALRVADSTKKQLSDYVSTMGLLNPCTDWLKSLHVTVMYSFQDDHTFVPDPHRTYIAEFKSLELYNPGDKRILMVKLKCDALEERHRELHDNFNLKHSFHDYFPHITLSYSFDGEVCENLPPMDFPFILHGEFVESLNVLKHS